MHFDKKTIDDSPEKSSNTNRPFDEKDMQELCDKNNARACAYIGEKTNNKDLLEKSAMLGSPLGYYYLAQYQQNPSTQYNLLKNSCEIGVDEDFTKGCEALGDLTHNTQERAELYAKSCNHLFYEQSACEKLYKIDPDLCNNEDICEVIAQNKKQKNLQDIWLAKQQKQQKHNMADGPYMRTIVDIQIGVTLMDFSAITAEETRNNWWRRSQNESEEGAHLNTLGIGAKVGWEFGIRRENFSVFATPFLGVSSHTGSITIGDDLDMEEDENAIQTTLMNLGTYAGIQYHSLRLYGILDCGFNFSNHPWKTGNMLGLGIGAGWVFSRSMSIDIQYIVYSYSYTKGVLRYTEWWDNDDPIFILDTEREQTSSQAQGIYLAFRFYF